MSKKAKSEEPDAKPDGEQPEDPALAVKRYELHKKFPHLPDAEVDRMARES